MKKLALISIVAATLLFVGCEKKDQAQSTTAQKSVEQKEVTPVHSEAAKSSEAKKAQEIQEPLPGVPMQKSSIAQSQSSESDSEKVEEVKKEVVKKVTEAKEAATKKAKEAAAAILPGTAAKEASTEPENKGDAAKGKELYAKCASCHGSDGKRKALGKSGVIAGMPKDEVAKKLKGYKAGSLNQYGMGALMKSQVATLSDSDIEALAAYISSLK